jgi:dsDNA-specific endonuclease/ATPase MutS2
MRSEDIYELPITDVLDLHTFKPAEIADVVQSYLDAAHEKEILQIRIIHGKGIGVQRETVRKILQRDPRVLEFSPAPESAGGWGATLVTLRDS